MTARKPRYFNIVYLFLLALCGFVPATTSAQANYNFTNVDYPGAEYTSVEGINDTATVVGSYFGSDGVIHGFLYDGSTYSSVNYPDSGPTGPAGINNSGVITGYHQDNQGTHGFVDNHGSFSSFDCPGGGAGQTNPHGINNNGEVVGVCYSGQGLEGFINNNGTFTFINYPGGCSTIAFGINDSGEIAGTYREGCSGNTHGFLYSGGTFTAIDYPGESQTYALGINNEGVVVGYSAAGGFSWKAGQFTLINPSSSPEVAGINNRNQIVGLYFPSGFEHGFLATPSTTQPLQFVPLPPCRVVDTRPPNGSGPIQGGTAQSFALPQEGACGSTIPASAAGYSLNVTVVPHGTLGYLTIWPTGQTQPTASLMNSPDGRVKANAAVVAAGTNQAVSVYVTDTTDVILDINGYFTPLPNPNALAFYPLTPCRVADTRDSHKPTGLGPPSLSAGVPRDFPVLNATTCNIPNTAQAYSLNFTVVPQSTLGYLTVWPKGENRPVISTLNDQRGTVLANAAIVPAGVGGDIEAYATQNTDLIIDINGYFAPPVTGGLSFYVTPVCRAVDTRHTIGAFSGTKVFNIVGSSCGIPGAAQAFVFNATVLPQSPLGYLTLWPDPGSRPVVSTLNAADGALTSNMAIVPNADGSTDAYATSLTQLLLDISGYFAP